MRLPIPGLSAIQQYPIAPDIVAKRFRQSAGSDANAGPIELQPMSPEEAQGVPREAQLTVHDADGFPPATGGGSNAEREPPSEHLAA